MSKQINTSEKNSNLSFLNSGKQNLSPSSGLILADNRSSSLFQKKQIESLQKKNNTGLPDNLKSGIENLSGISMDDVKVHYNSSQPSQLNAHAYAQGTNIHVASGQEKHLAHEAWHVVQQKQGRVKATKQLKSYAGINDDEKLEKEADVMGAKALQRKTTENQMPVLLKKELTASAETFQLQIKNVVASGVTHLVRLNEQGSLYQHDYIANEVAETKQGDIISIESDYSVRSRRGPNQEQDPDRDEKRNPDYLWVNALSFNKRNLPPHSFIRAGTFQDVHQQDQHLVEQEAEQDRRGNLLLPYNIPLAQGVFLIDASHRGDMYHMRAAMSVHHVPLIIYNVRGENDLTHYLSGTPDSTVFKLPYNPADPAHEDFRPGFVFRSANVLSESNATEIVAREHEEFHQLDSPMAKVPQQFIPVIGLAVEQIFSRVPANAALLMYRNTGQTSQVYPELDSGEALPQLAEMINRKGLTPVFCGAPNTGQYSAFPNIGEYWIQLNEILVSHFSKAQLQQYKRDSEAEFMKQAYLQKKFRLVVGFRSGALDLFTFLGIPTISISLKDLVGEDRHSKFSHQPSWQRTNVQYNIPRNEVTRLMHGRGDSKLFMSPHWKMRGGREESEPPQDERRSIIPPPHEFHHADMETIDRGLEVAVSRLGTGKFVPGPITSESLRLPPVGSTEQEEMFIQASLQEALDRRLRYNVYTFEHRRNQEENLITNDSERSVFNAETQKMIRVMIEKGKIEIELTLRERKKNAIQRERSATEKSMKSQSQQAAASSSPAVHYEPLSPDDRLVFNALKNTPANRINVTNSKDSEETTRLFGLNAEKFWAAVVSLKTKKLIHYDREGIFLTGNGKARPLE